MKLYSLKVEKNMNNNDLKIMKELQLETMDEKTKDTDEWEQLPPLFLILTICLSSIGIFTNAYSMYYLKWNFNLSRLLYKLLMFCCIITLSECSLMVTMGSLLFMIKNDLVCMIFQIVYVAPKFLVINILLQISLLRCIAD